MIAKRIDFIDSLKGLTILFVLWGHSIQYLRDGIDYIHNPVFEFLYAFHMPMFFLISGFFFNSALKLNFKAFIKKKILQLLLPCFTWALIFVILHLIFSNSVDLIRDLKMIINPVMWPFWFLKELFISYFLVFVFYRILKRKWIVFLVSISFVLVAPYCGMQRFLLPLFLFGIILKDNYQFFLNHLKWTLFISGVVFLVCLLFWDGNYTIYLTPFPKLVELRTMSFNFTNIDISLLRLLIGLSGSVFLFLLFQLTYSSNWINTQLEKFGIQTMSIYILQVTLLENIANLMLNFPTVNVWIYSLVITLIISLLILMLCIFITDLIAKNQHLSLILFGTSPKTWTRGK